MPVCVPIRRVAVAHARAVAGDEHLSVRPKRAAEVLPADDAPEPATDAIGPELAVIDNMGGEREVGGQS